MSDLPAVLFSAEDIALRLRALCKELAALPERPQVAAPVLVGAFVFASDLVRGLAENGVHLETEMKISLYGIHSLLLQTVSFEFI